jgi:hypothetical protein
MGGLVRLYLANETTHVITPDGFSHQALVDTDGKRFIETSREFAQIMLNPGPPPNDNLAIRAANAELAAELGQVPPLQPGINAARYLARQREAFAPRSLAETTQETLAAYGRGLR